MPQLPEQIQLKDYLKAMQSAKTGAIDTFIETAEAKIPKGLQEEYQSLVKDMIKLFVVALFMQVPEATGIADVLSTKKIMLNDWCRYVVLSAYVLPNMTEGDVKLKEALRLCTESVHKAIQTIEGVKDESTQIFFEGFLGSAFSKVKSLMWRGFVAVAKGIALFASQIINVYNVVFDSLTYPVRKLLKNTIGGSLIGQAATLPLYFLVNAYPGMALVGGIHKVITSPMVKQGAPMVSKLISGKFWKDLDKQLEDITKDIDIDALEKEFDTVEEPTKETE
jgi:hypothetical protein